MQGAHCEVLAVGGAVDGDEVEIDAEFIVGAHCVAFGGAEMGGRVLGQSLLQQIQSHGLREGAALGARGGQIELLAAFRRIVGPAQGGAAQGAEIVVPGQAVAASIEVFERLIERVAEHHALP